MQRSMAEDTVDTMIKLAICAHEDKYHGDVSQEKPQTETVGVIRTMCRKCGSWWEPRNCTCNCHSDNYVVMTGSYERPVKPKVKRREEFTIRGTAFVKESAVPISNDATFYAEWVE